MSKNEALDAQDKYRSQVEKTAEYVEFFDILETINNVGNDEVFTPRKVVDMMLDSLPEEIWHNPDYRWLNPASKTGIFEREIAIRLDEGLKDIIPDTETRRKHILQNMIFSIGQTKFTANVARRTLYYCCQANRACDGVVEDGHYVNGYAIGNGTWFDDPEGNIKTPCTDHTIKGNKCIYCGIDKKSKYLDANQREKYSYDFIHNGPGDELQTFLANRFFGGDKSMKFDVIIGNPPYQLSDGGNGASAMPIYQKFVMQAKSLKPKYISMIVPARWYAGGKGLDDFRSNMLADDSIVKLVDFVNAKDCFPNLSIGGGICYFLIDRDYHGPCTVINCSEGKESTSFRSLSDHGVFIRYNNAIPILNKVKLFNEDTLNSVVMSRNVFGLTSSFRGQETKDSEHPISVKSSGGISYCSIDDIKQGHEYVGQYKVVLSYLTAEHAGEPAKDGRFSVISTSQILNPGEICTESYLVLYATESLNEANCFMTYLKTKFFRFLLLLSISSIHLSKDKFQFVPIQEFSHPYSDDDLNAKYGLSNDEIGFIDSMIKEKVRGCMTSQ